MGLIITHEDFINGGEVDCTAHYKGTMGKFARVSIRQIDDAGIYEVYARYHATGREEVLKHGSLQQCVVLTNYLLDLDDIVVVGH